VSAALAQGRGVVFLGGNVGFNNLVPKIAMNRLNLEVLAFFQSKTWLFQYGLRRPFLNRLYRDIENRQLKERFPSRPLTLMDRYRAGIHIYQTRDSCTAFAATRGRLK
jgi:hypothetical protein